MTNKIVHNSYQKLPDTPGVYIFKDKKNQILYVGKAGNLRRRVFSYFERPHDSRIQKLVSEIKKIDYKKTDTAIEALILEAELIKKLEPPFNIREKDDKSFLYVEITKDRFPRVLLVRGKSKPDGVRFGPFTSASSIREALRIIRRIFPYSTHSFRQVENAVICHSIKKRACFDYEIGLCPGTCIGAISRTDYIKNIKNIKLFFGGKKKRILASLLREMNTASKKLDFEKAEGLRRQIFSLQHIQDVALINDSEISLGRTISGSRLRIEGYDISNISGTSAVGSMVVFSGNQPDRNEYRKFRIRTITESNDVGMLKEVLRRRFHRIPPAGGWPIPDVILIDGGRGQVNAAKMILDEFNLRIPVVGIAKGLTRKKNEFVGSLPKNINRDTLVRVRDEAHRFAIAYHRKLRGGAFIQNGKN